MRRLILFLGAMGWGARLQMLAVIVILGGHIQFDVKKGRWRVTIGLVCVAWLIGWLLKPLMVANQQRTLRIWNAISIAVLAAYVLGQNQWWWNRVGPYFAREFVLWLDLSCGYWFVSEIRLQQERQLEDSLWQDNGGAVRDRDRFDRPNDDFGEREVSAP